MLRVIGGFVAGNAFFIGKHKNLVGWFAKPPNRRVLCSHLIGGFVARNVFYIENDLAGSWLAYIHRPTNSNS